MNIRVELLNPEGALNPHSTRDNRFRLFADIARKRFSAFARIKNLLLFPNAASITYNNTSVYSFVT